MEVLSIGVDHHVAPLDLRARIAVSLDQFAPALQSFKSFCASLGIKANSLEAAFVSTCNRTELYCVSEHGHAEQHALQWISSYHGVPMDELRPHVQTRRHSDAVRHAFRVASGLDSMVLGETQILGQMKDQVRTASEAGALGAYLNELFQRTFAVAKEVRSATEIGAGSVSMASAAIRLAKQRFDGLAGQRVLCIGAGEMIQLCATHFAAQGPSELVVANRTADRGARIAQSVGGRAMALADVPHRMHEFDIVVSCTASTLPIIGFGAAQRAMSMRGRKPMFFIDLAVPRDIEPEVGRLENVRLYTVDDLGAVVLEGHASRRAAVERAETIIEARVGNFMKWLQARNIVPEIRRMHAKAEQWRLAELERAHKMLARGDEPARVLDALSRALTNKLLHRPTHALNHAGSEHHCALIETIRALYEL